MKINELKKRPSLEDNKKLHSAYKQLENLLDILKSKELPEEVMSSVNQRIEEVNSISESEKELKKQIKKSQTSILKLIEKELQLVTKNHHRNLWLALGMAAFGLPLGLTFGTSMGNMGLLGLGLPIGMVIGLVLGTAMDKKAAEAGKQLDLEIKY